MEHRISRAEIGQRVGAHKLHGWHEARSPFVVVLIPEYHDAPRCQAEVFDALEALEPVTSFVAVEGRVGEVRHEDLFGAFFDRGTTADYTVLTGLSWSERQQTVNGWRASGEFPRAAGLDLPLHAALVFEAVYQDRVRSQGLENREVYLRAARVADFYERARLPTIPRTTIIDARNRVFVRKLEHYGGYLSREGGHFAQGRHVVPFPVGAYHVQGLIRRLRRAGITHTVLVNPACTPPHLRPPKPPSSNT